MAIRTYRPTSAGIRFRTGLTFDEALEAAYKDLAEDTKMIRERRKMRKMKMMEKRP